MLSHTCVCLCVYYYRRLLYVFYYIMLDIGERAFELMFLVVTFAIPMKIKIIYHIYLSIRDIVRVGVAVRPYHLPTPKLTLVMLNLTLSWSERPNQPH